MVKKLAAVLCVLVLLACSLVVAAYLAAPVAAQELKLNIAKYALMNVNKNYGYKKFILSKTLQFVRALPIIDATEIQRLPAQKGTSAAKTLDYIKPSNTLVVSSPEEILDAIESAVPGTTIVIETGSYEMLRTRTRVGNAGSLIEPIVLTAQPDVILKFVTTVGLNIDKPHWIIENIEFMGACDYDDKCQHAIHLTGDADNVIIQNNTFRNFNAHIKSNGVGVGTRSNPDNVKIIKNTFINDWARQTSSAVTPIDVVGGDNWLVQGNFIADFSKNGGNRVAYGAFLKGESTRGQFIENLVVCAWRVPHYSELDIRIGLSLGGGGTGDRFCDDGVCKFEHSQGLIDSNVIANCQNDVGVYINRSTRSIISNNHIYSTLGVDVRFQESTAVLENNVIQGRIKARDGATVFEQNNELLGF